MEKQLLVREPQYEKLRLITIDETGGYFDENRILWDSSKDGEMSDVLKAELLVQQNNDEAERQRNEYKIHRKNEMPPIEAQLDMIYHLGIDGWKAEIKKIKDKYPKPSDA